MLSNFFIWTVLDSVIIGSCVVSKDGVSEKRTDLLYNYDRYQTYTKISSELRRLSKTYPRLFELKTIGKTFERRDILSMQVSNKSKNPPEKKKFIIECGAHAREWISPATCMNMIKKLSNIADKQSNYLLTNFNIIIIPLLNPDGYSYTWKNKSTRKWRKNRSINKKSINNTHNCIGVDINRNFAESWGGPGSSDDACGNVYSGRSPLSEAESRSLVKYIKSIKDDIIAYLCLHSYGQTWTTPWGYSSKKPKDFDDLIKVARIARDAIRKVYGTKYSVGNAHNYISSSSGNVIDYLHAELKIKYTYFIEMRPKKAEFIVPENIMLKNSEEMFQGLYAISKALKN